MSFYNRAIAYRTKQDYDRSIADFTAAIALDANDAAPYIGRDYRGAIADFSEAIRLEPNDASAYTARRNAYNAVGEIDHADADFNPAKRLSVRPPWQ